MYLASGWLDQHSWVPGSVIGVVFGIASIVLAIVLYRISRERRTIDYRFTSRVRILSPMASNLSNLMVTHRQHQLTDPRIVRIEFKNTGNRAVRAEDFDYPIKVENHGNARAIDVFLVGESYPNMVGELFDPAAGNRYVNIRPRLLNKNDSFEVQFLYEGPTDIKISCHFTDQSRPMKEFQEAVNPWRFYDWRVTFVAPVVIICVSYAMWRDGTPLLQTVSLFVLGSLAMVVPPFITFLLKSRRQRS